MMDTACVSVVAPDSEMGIEMYALWYHCMLGRLDSSVPRSKRLLSDDRSNILVYMTGVFNRH